MPIVPALIVVYALTLGQCADIPREVFEPLNDIAQGCVRDEESRGATFRALRKWCATQDPPIKLTHDEQRCLHAHADSLRRLAKRRALLGLNGANKGNDDGGEISYVVVRDETNDVGAIKAEVINSIAVSGAVNEQNLRKVMFTIFRAIRERVGYKYYTHPTNVYIDVYTSEEHAKAEGGTWIAQLSWIEDEGRKPELTFRKERFRRSAPLKPRFGLSIEEQKELYKGIILVEIQADIDAEREIPAWRDGAGWSKLKSKLTKRYANALAKRYRLSRKQLEAIALEGDTYGWPMPTDIPWFDTPVLDPKLKPGKKYRLSKETPVMQHYAPADPLQAIVDMQILAPGATIVVNERRMKNGDHPWYKVTAVNPGAPRKIRGWINYLAFVGQDVHEVP